MKPSQPPLTPANLEETLIMDIGASAGTQIIRVAPDPVKAEESLGTQLMAVPGEPTVAMPIARVEEATVAMSIPRAEAPTVAMSIPRAEASTVAIPALSHPAPAPPPFGDPLATQVLDPQSHLKPPQPPELPLAQPSLQVLLNTPPSEEPASRQGLWLAVTGGVVVLGLALWYLVDRQASAPAPAVQTQGQAGIPAPIPLGYEETFKQAQAGDVAAMRTLGAVYTYGLGVPPHREEGLRWYRKAAEAGSTMAAQEAKALEKGLK